MGIDIESKLLVGVEYKDIKDWLENKLRDENTESEDIYELIEELGFEYASPWFDSDIGNWFIGIPCTEYGSPSTVIEDIESAVRQFKALTAIDPIVNATQHVY